MKRVAFSLGLVALGLLLVAGAGRLHQPLHIQRQAHDLIHAEPIDNAPPLVVFSTVALGGFSGLIADILWMRAGQLQLEGNYLELVQLADWITSLQPRFADGWVYHAWNLAYNVSVMFQRPEDRWRWVRHGIALLRDRGLRYNPRSATLYRELSWLFQHKMGTPSDSAFRFYQQSWAAEMSRLFDGPGPDYLAMADVPSTRAELLRLRAMPELIAALNRAGYDPFTYEWPPDERMPEFMDILRDSAAGTALLDHLRLRMLIDHYRLDPQSMQAMEIELGPMDWRLPHAHALYWAWRGRRYAHGFEASALDRAIFQNLAENFYQGRLVIDRDAGLFLPSPNPDSWPFVLAAYEEFMSERDLQTMRVAYLNFMNRALSIMYMHNRMTEAEEIFERIERQFPEEVDGRALADYAVAQMVDRVEHMLPSEALALVQGAWMQHYFWIALGEDERAAGYARLARETWAGYMAPRREHPDWMERTGLPPLDTIRRQARQLARENWPGQVR